MRRPLLQLTSLLHTSELADVVPKKRVEHVTLRLGEGKTVLLGGLAQIHMRSGLPFLFTFFLANSITIHPTSTEKVCIHMWLSLALPYALILENVITLGVTVKLPVLGG